MVENVVGRIFLDYGQLSDLLKESRKHRSKGLKTGLLEMPIVRAGSLGPGAYFVVWKEAKFAGVE